MAASLPEKGLPKAQILDHLAGLKERDIAWSEGRAPIFVFKAEQELSDLNREAFNLYFVENALGAHRAFASIKQMESDIISIGLKLFNGPEGSMGYFTTGGSESITCAMKAARNWAREKRGDPQFRGNMVVAETCHPAFTKACDLMDIELRKIPVGADFKADPVAMEAAIDENTYCMVGSMPCYPYGVIDPIEALSEVAQRHGLWLHVDACVGGYIAPFAAELGRDVPPWDFRVPGVCSISADVHKFGYAPKPASTVFFRSEDYGKHLMFKYNDWPSGIYATATIVGTRPGGGVAGAWATLHGLGHDGYLRVTQNLLNLVDRYKAGIGAIPGLRVLADPPLSIITCTSDEIDLVEAGSRLTERGWLPGFLQKPRGMHLMLSMIHEPACDKWLADLRWAVEQHKASQGGAEKKVEISYS